MSRLGKTTAALARYRRQWQKMAAKAGSPNGLANGGPPVGSRLSEVAGFGSNPGNLRMWTYRPDRLPASPALVVVLHGCTQTAAGYDHGAGWSTLADRYGLVLLFPEQQRVNNPNLCFNWFQAGDIERGGGEAASIRQMVERVAVDHGVDRRRIFVTGLSAGGAMTSVMLATYPEVFAGGAIVAGLPYGCAANVQEAFESMFQSPPRPASDWGDLVRAASPHRGPWPKVSIWHGSADATVVPVNAAETLKQWTDVHGLPQRPTATDTVDGYPRSVWRSAEGDDLIESYTITGMAHGTPLATGDGEGMFGAAGPFLLEVGISSSHHIARFWGLTGDEAHAADEPRPEAPAIRLPSRAEPSLGPTPRATPVHVAVIDREDEVDGSETPGRASERPEKARGLDIAAVINNALRSAGLIKH